MSRRRHKRRLARGGGVGAALLLALAAGGPVTGGSREPVALADTPVVTLALSPSQNPLALPLTLTATLAPSITADDALTVEFQDAPADTGNWSSLGNRQPFFSGVATPGIQVTTLPDGLYDFRAVYFPPDGGAAQPSPTIRDQLVANQSPWARLQETGSGPGLTTGSALRGTVTLQAAPVSSGGVSVSSAKFEISPAGQEQWRMLAMVAAANDNIDFDYEFDTTQVPDGTYDLRAVPIDANGTAYAALPVRAVTVDNTPPTVSMSNPGSSITGTVKLSAQADDAESSGFPGSGVTSVVYERAISGTTAWTQVASSSDGPFSASVDTSGWANRAWDLRAVATDRAGNVGISNTVTVNTGNTATPAPVPAVTGVAVPARDVTMLGSDDAGETWAFGFTTAPPATVNHTPLPYTAPGNQLVLLRYTQASGWQIADVPRLAPGPGGAPYQLLPADEAGTVTAVGAMTPSGEAWLWINETGTSGVQPISALFHRVPGGTFVDDPSATQTLAATVLAGGTSSAQLRLGQTADGQVYGTFVNPSEPPVQAVVPGAGGAPVSVNEQLQYGVLQNGSWTVHAAPLPPASSYVPRSGDSITLTNGDATGPSSGWGLLRTGTSQVPLLLGHFDGDSWSFVNTGLDALDLTGNLAAIPGAKVVPTGLAVDGDMVWVGANDSWPTGNSAASNDVVALFDATTGTVTNSWCSLPVATSCAQPLGAATVPDAVFHGSDGTTAVGLAPRGALDVFADGGWRSVPAPGYSAAQGGAFTDIADGWLGSAGATAGQVTPAGSGAGALASWPIADRAPLTGIALPPGNDGSVDQSGAVAVGFAGTALSYDAQNGWQVQPTPAREHHLNLTSVAFNGPSSAFAVGQDGAIIHWDGSSWAEDPQSISITKRQLNAITFDASGQGWAVGSLGTILHYDGQSWSAEQPPVADAGADLTAVAIVGTGPTETVFAIAGGNLIVRQSDGSWAAGDPSLLPSDPPAPGSLRLVAGLPDGGAVIAGISTMLVLQPGHAAFAYSDQPIEGIPVALSAFESGGTVRAAVSVAQPAASVFLPFSPTNDIGGYPAGDGELLISTDDGWQDLSRAQPAGSAADLPGDGEMKADPVLGVVASPDGQRLWAVGGYDGTPTSTGLGTAQPLAVRAPAWQTASLWRYDAGGSATAPQEAQFGPSLPATPGTVSFAFFSSPECRVQCAGTENAQPDVNLSGAIGEMNAFATQAGGPLFAMLGGNAVGPDDSNSWNSGTGAADFANLPGILAPLDLPLFAAFGPKDYVPGQPDPTQPWAYAFADSPAPFAGGGAAPGITPVSSGSAAPGTVSRYYSFDATQDGATVRVIVLDNSKGSLDGSDAGQTAWLDQQLASADGTPMIVVAAESLDDASDGASVAQQLVDAGVLAVFTGPLDGYLNERHDVPDGAAATIPEYEGGTLTYQQSGNDAVAWYDVSVDTQHRTVSVDAVPVVQSLALDPLDGLTTARGDSLQFQAIGRRPPGSIASSPSLESNGSSPYPGYDNYVEIPASGCSTCVTPTYSFTSSNTQVGNFVTPYTSSSSYAARDSKGNAIINHSSGLFCAFQAGTTTVSITAGLLSYSLQVTVPPSAGSLGKCGGNPLAIVASSSTTRLAALRHGSIVVKSSGGSPATPPPPPPATAAATSSPPPAVVPPPVPAPAHGVPPAPAPAPRPVVPHAVPPPPQPSPLVQSTAPLLLAVPLAIVPPPAVATQPIPPGGAAQQPATAERREKAHKHAHSNAYTLLSPASNTSDPAAWWYDGAVGVTSLMAFALAGQALRPRRRPKVARAVARRR